MRYFWFFLVLVLVPLAHLNAQESQLLEPGARVRVSTAPVASEPDWMVGTFISGTGDHLTIHPEQDSAHEVELLRTINTRVEVSQGQHSKWLTGLGLGLLTGVGVGGAIGYFVAVDDPQTEDGYAIAIIGAVSGGLGGALVGGLIGSGIKVDRWQVVPLATVGSAHSPDLRIRLLVSLQL